MASLNPIKAIEELIVEHGSAVVQGKHIALLREQLTILKEQFSILERENAQLKSENENLKSKKKAEKDVGVGLAPILEVLHSGGPTLPLARICELTGIDSDTIAHVYASRLEDDDFVSIERDDSGFVLTLTILPGGRTAWIRHRDFMRLTGR